jgi:hypothetical protein
MCKRILCLAFICCLLGLADPAGAGLVGWWKLDETAGDTAADATGNGHTGTLIAGPTWAAGHIGGALQFAGSGQKVDVPYSEQLNPADRFSVSVWANPAPEGTDYRSPITSRQGTPQGGYIIYATPSNTWQFWTGTGTAWDATAGPPVRLGEWTHVVGTYSLGAKQLYVNGDLVGQGTSNMPPNRQAVLRIGGGATEGNGNYFFVGLVDDVQVYDRVLSPGQVKGIFTNSSPASFVKADRPTPADGATAVSQGLLQWSPGDGAVLHNVYLGTSRDLTQADLVGPKLPFTMYYHVAGLQPGATYYWRVDELDAGGTVTTGDVWSFTATPKTAWAQQPGDGARYLAAATTLAWSAGLGAISHTVYLGTDPAAVEAGAPETRKAEKITTTSYAPIGLEAGRTYYWRVDEILVDGTTVPGPVWSFTVRPVIEKTDPDLLAWWKLDDEESPFAVDYSGYDHYGTLRGNPQWVQGFLGDALQFNGLNDYVDLGTPADLYLPGTYTYCAWFKSARDIAANSGSQYLLCIGTRSDLCFGVADGVGADGDLSLHYYDTAATFHAVSVGQTVWQAGEWHMVAATKDASGHKIYLDGELKNSDTNTLDDNYATTRMISLGARGWTDPKIAFFNGALDDVRIYNRALTADEIQQTMRGDPRIAWAPQPKSGATLDIRDATSLSWSAGDTAAQHDVYFGQDKGAVKDADTTSPLYQGRQTGTSFSLAGLVEIGGGSCFWRIDEVEADGATIHKGAVWSFFVPDYLMVDDFESYTDEEGNRIYETWIDGWTNGTGSVVGNLQAPFAEQTIVHSGRQAMPMDYNNTESPYYSEAELDFAPLQDWTVGDVNTLSLWFRGRPATVALMETAPGQVKFGSNSPDVWGTSDNFAFYYKTLSGDGSISAKVVAVTDTTTNWAKAGVMIRESLDPASAYGFMFPTPDGRRAFQDRPTAGVNAVSAHSATGVVTLPFWVKVERKGSMVTAYYSTDGTTWTRQPDTENTGTDRSLNPQTIPMGTNILIGLAVTSNNVAGTQSAYGEFADIVTTGSVGGAWKLVKIGTSYANDPDKLYVAVEDSAGKSALVTHADPAATGLTIWTPWKIPLTDLAGVNLAKVKKLYLGVGDKVGATHASPVPGATGRLYFDDIRVVK